MNANLSYKSNFGFETDKKYGWSKVYFKGLGLEF